MARQGEGARTKNLAEVAALSGKRGRYQKAMPAQLDRTGEDQISLTDPDSRAWPRIRRSASATTFKWRTS